MKYIVNPVTGEYESTTYTFRDRFSLGGDAQPPETQSEGQVAGALLDAFPKQSFLEYQNAVEEGYQGTMEEFLRDNSDKSKLDMEAIEGQTAGIKQELMDKAIRRFSRQPKDLNKKYLEITKKKNFPNFTELNEQQKGLVKSLYIHAQKVAARPDTYKSKIAGDVFDLPFGKGIQPSTVNNFKKAYPLLKKLDKNPTVDNYYKEVTGKNQGANVLINDIQTYLTGSSKDKSTRPLFERPNQLKFIKSLDLKNKLKPETIQLLKDRKGKKAADLYKIQQGMKEAAAEAVMKKKGPALKKLNEIFKMDPDVGPDELINEFYGDAYLKASKAEQRDMFKKLSNDVVTYYKVADKTRVKPEGVRLPNEDKLFDIVDNIKYQTGKGGYRFGDGFLRDIKNAIAQSITNPGYSYNSKIASIGDKFPGKNIDHTTGLSAVHEVAPGYSEAIQIINPRINKEKGVLLERPLTKILDDFFTNTLNKPRKIGGKIYSNFDDKVAAYNNLSKEFATQNGIDTAILKFSKPGTGPSPKETVKYFNEFTKGAQKNMMEVWNNHGFTMTVNSRPMGSEFFGKTYKPRKTNKNMGGMVEVMDNTLMMAQGGRVNFSEGTDARQLLATLESDELLKLFEESRKNFSSQETDMDISYTQEEIDKMMQAQIDAQEARNQKKANLSQEGFIEKQGVEKFKDAIDPAALDLYYKSLQQGVAQGTEFLGGLFVKPVGMISNKTLGTNFDTSLTNTFLDKVNIPGIGSLENMTKQARERAAKKGLDPIVANYSTQAKFAGDVLTPLVGLGTTIKLSKKISKEIKNAVGSNMAKNTQRQIEEKLSNSGMSRRDFNKIVATGGVLGLAKALGLDKLIPMGSKVAKAAKTAPIVTPGGTPKYFFDFVNLIKKSGDDITEKASTLERQKVYEYEGYQLTEDLTTGEQRITTPNSNYEGVYQESEMFYKPGEDIVNEKTGKSIKSIDEYTENTAKPDRYGDMEDGYEGIDDIDDILDILGKGGKKYNLKELEEMGLNPSGLNLKNILKDPTEANLLKGDDTFKDTMNKTYYKLDKSEKAGGGIMKLAGNDSGPPPTSGPDSEGLALILKRDRKY